MTELLDRASLNPLKKKCGLCSLFRYSSCADKFMMILATVCSFVHGAAFPMILMFFAKTIRFLVLTDVLRSRIQNELSDFMADKENSWQNIFKDTSTLNPDGCFDLAVYYKNKKMTWTCGNVVPYEGRILWLILVNHCIPYGVITVAVLFLTFGHMSLWMRTAEKQVMRMRRDLIKSIMLHDVKWFNKFEPTTLKEVLHIDIYKIKDGILDKVGSVVQWLGTCVVGLGIGFYYNPLLACVVSAVGILKVLTVIAINLVTVKAKTIEMKAYEPAERVARNAVSGIWTVVAYDGQDFEIKEYNKSLKKTSQYMMKKSITKAFSLGFFALLSDAYFAVGFFVAAMLTSVEPSAEPSAAPFIDPSFNTEPTFNIEAMLVVLLCIHIALFYDETLGLSLLDGARVSAFTIYSIIDEVKDTSESEASGHAPEVFQGHVEFKNVSRVAEVKRGIGQRQSIAPEKELDNVSVAIPAGSTVALIGTLGSGVRLIPELLLRFEEPTSGEILFDGQPVDSYCLSWLRHNIGYVTSDPVLFSTSIGNNVRFHKVDATDQEIIAALQRANVWTMISDIPGGLNFLLGRKNAQINLTLSQRQRICLATALITEPKILILDRVTARMEGQTCFLTEEAIREAKKDRTTFIIPNNLEQLEMADLALVMREGKVAELDFIDKINFESICNLWQDVNRRNMTLEGLAPCVHNVMRSTEGRSVISRKSIASAAYALRRKSTLMRGIARDVQPHLKRRQYRQSVYSALRGTVKEEVNKKEEDFSYGRLFRLNSAEFAFIILGCLTSVINGFVFMAIAHYFSQLTIVFTHKKEDLSSELEPLYKAFITICIINFAVSVIKHFCFTLSGDRLTKKIRMKTFAALMKQDLKWFDGHDTAKVITSLREDSKTAQELTGLRIGNNLFSFVIVVTTLAVSLKTAPLVTLILFANLPILFFFGYTEVKWLARIREEYAQAHYKASKVAMESFKNIRTVTYLSAQDIVAALYMDHLKDAHIFSLKTSVKVSLVYAVCQFVIFSSFISSFAWIAFLIEESRINGYEVFVVYSFILFAVIGLGSTKKLDYEVSRSATQNICSVMDSLPDIDYTSFSGRKIRGRYNKDEVRFENVSFSYPANPDQLVLDKCSFSIPHESRVCLAGHEGNGNFAVLDLMLRMYDPAKGVITLASDKNLKKLNVKWLRSQVGIISSTTAFFDRSVAANLAYGDTSRVVSQEEMEWATKTAEVYPAIMNLENGFEEKCDDLADIDKFKLDLARILIKSPKIVMIESIPTSNVSDDKLAALNLNLLRVTAGRTVLTIPNQMYTLQTCDKIMVFQEGRVVAEGPPADLAKTDGDLHLMLAQNCPWVVEYLEANRRVKSDATIVPSPPDSLSKKSANSSKLT